MREPDDAFGAHILTGTLGHIGDREIGAGHVVLSEQRYQWLLARARAVDGLDRLLSDRIWLEANPARAAALRLYKEKAVAAGLL